MGRETGKGHESDIFETKTSELGLDSCGCRLRHDMFDVVHDDVDPKPSRSEHSVRNVFVVLHMNEVLAKLEPLQNFFLDHRAVEGLSCSWVLLSQLIDRVMTEILLDVILLCDAGTLRSGYVSSGVFCVLCLVFCTSFPIHLRITRVRENTK